MNGIADKRLKAEVAEMALRPPPGTSAAPREGNLRVWDALIIGPQDTPYEGGKFNLKLEFWDSYPFIPPVVKFKTRIYHCNINTIGNICLDILKTADNRGTWTSGMGIAAVLLSIQQLMRDPNPSDPLMLTVAQQYNSDKGRHDQIAKLWTKNLRCSVTLFKCTLSTNFPFPN